MDWKSIFLPDTPIFEIILRGSIMYLALFAMLRIVLKRQTGTLGMTDLLLITLLADASQNAMAGEYKSIPDGLVLVGTIIFWNYLLDWLSFHSEWFSRLIEPPPLPLIRNGRMLRRNMRSELITEEELRMELRLQGMDDLSNVKEAFIESDGRISVIENKANVIRRMSEKSPKEVLNILYCPGSYQNGCKLFRFRRRRPRRREQTRHAETCR